MSKTPVPFEFNNHLPAYLANARDLLDINKEVVRAAAFPVMSIKGMRFTLVEDGVRRVLTKPDDPEEVAQSIAVVFLRANMKAKTFFAKKYTEGESDGQRPDCYSYDGVEPSPNAINPQASKCALCPHNQWGSRIGEDGEYKGKACQDNARIAISAPDKLKPTLLRVPPASLKNLREMLKVVAGRKIPYNAVIVKVGFDREAPSPKLTFKPIDFVDDATYAKVRDLYDDEVVRAIVGLDDFPAELGVSKETESTVETDELDAAIAVQETKTGAETETVEDALEDIVAPPKVDTPTADKPKADKLKKSAKAEEPASKATKTPDVSDVSDVSDLMNDLDALLGGTDD